MTSTLSLSVEVQMSSFDDWLYEEACKSREFFFGFVKETSYMSAYIMRQRAIDAVKNLSHEDGVGMGSARIEEAIKNLKIQGEDE
jgi:hypothetical protein